MTNVFKIKKYLILTIGMVLCSLATFAQELTDQEIGYDVTRITQRLKEKGLSDSIIKKEIALYIYENENLKGKPIVHNLIADKENIIKNKTSKVLVSVPKSERDALIALYYATDGPNWPSTLSGVKAWPVNDPGAEVTGDWSGVSIYNGHVIGLQLVSLNGSIPDLSALQNINALWLTGALSGTLDGLKNLKNLSVLRIGYDQLSPCIFESILPISNLDNLSEMAFNCSFNIKSIPIEFDKLVNLKKIELRSDINQGLSTLGNLKSLTHILLQCNFSGSLPSNFSNLTNLEFISMFNNKIDDISILSNLTRLKYFDFAGNKISVIPSDFNRLTNLLYIDLFNNNIKGDFPIYFKNLQLINLNIGYNHEIGGPIPPLNFTNQDYSYIIAGSGRAFSSMFDYRNLFITENKFRFIDFANEYQYYKSNTKTFHYNYQSKTDEKKVITASVGGTVTLTMCEDGRYIKNVDTFQWYKGVYPNGVLINDDKAKARQYTISNLTVANAGNYYCLSKNPEITTPEENLILQREPITLNVVNCNTVAGTLKASNDNPTVGANTTFSLEPVATGLTYKWIFYNDANGTTVKDDSQTSATASQSYSIAGNYLVRLEVKDANGCMTTFNKFIEVKNYCNRKPISFAFETTDTNLNYTWTTTNAAGVVVSEVSNTTGLYTYTPTLVGNYVVELIATGEGKCKKVLSEPITVVSCDPVLPVCENHIAIVVDESGSVDETEAKKIRAQLKSFIKEQAKVNEEGLGNMYITLIGMSDSDADTRADKIMEQKVTSADLSSTGNINSWIDNYGRRFGKLGISAGSDYWKSGLDAVANSPFRIKPKLVLLITDGCQTANPVELKKTMEKFDNYQNSTDTSLNKPHLYVVGIDNGFYVDNPVTTKILARNEDPNYVPSIQKSSLTSKNSATLSKSLQYLFNYQDNAFPIERINGFDSASYFGHKDFTLLTQEPYYFSDNIVVAGVGCGKESKKEYCANCLSFQPEVGGEYLLSAWVKEETNIQVKNYENSEINIVFYNNPQALDPDPKDPNAPKQIISTVVLKPKGDIIDGWQRISGRFVIPNNTITAGVVLDNKNVGIPVYFDDLRIHPVEGSVKTFVYDPETFKLMSELDENNYSTFYEYDNEGGLVRVKKETAKGVKTIQETRSGNAIEAN
ncbi:leucine-rich repeat domain-containing protein [Flavobacterium aestivum]|uniref:leucine-rich repeat domain-containing protein n=1 Tax=Flavobacterium aestivum TaxID=3003257 RepID=UPI002482ABB4|nr:leucine-rich repeat domain-containing protein [Flavobacterium aestivum]